MGIPRELQHDTLRTIYSRRAVRAYAPQQPSDASIRELLDAAVQAPTAMHLEPWSFVVVQDKARLERYSDRAKLMLLQELESSDPFAHAVSRTRIKTMLSERSFNIFYDAGTLIVICGRQMGPYVQADCWLAAENLMLAACALGLATCCIGFALGVLNTPEAKQELAIPADVMAVAPIIVGFPAMMPDSVSRKPPHVLSWLRAGGVATSGAASA